MRTWQQLIEAAESTGTWDTYVGDGASIPWETCGVVAPPFALTMLGYKQWLDARYPQAFRLHDWLYTPYGNLIAATQAEADSAMAAQILAIGGPTAVIDSAVVFTACDLLGSYFFGVSTVDFDQALYDQAVADAAPIKTGRNMPSAGGRVSVAMSIKVVVLFQQVTVPGYSNSALGLAGRSHIAGWSESMWYPSNDAAALWRALTTGPVGGVNWGYLPVRADLMTANASIVGVRLYEGGTGKGNFRAIAYPGLYAAGVSDIPQMSILAYIGLTGSTRARRLTIRGVPDEMATGGEFTPTSAYATRLVTLGQALTGFGAVTKDDSAGLPLLTVSDAGVCQLNGVPPTWAVGDGVTFRSVLTSYGARVGGTFACTAVVPASNQFTVAGWPHGACTGGNALIPAFSQKAFTSGSLAVSRLLTRKVGRPFEQYRGRRSKRQSAA